MELDQKIIEYLEKTETLIVKEAPGFVQEAINFYFYKELIAVIECLAVLSLLLYSVRFILSQRYKLVLIDLDFEDPDMVQKVSLLVPSAGFFFASLISMDNLVNFIQICISPRLYLLERLVN